MTITTEPSGIQRATLDTDAGAEIHALYDDYDFYVTMTRAEKRSEGDGWFFGAEDCREAAEFFTKLADELDRRNA